MATEEDEATPEAVDDSDDSSIEETFQKRVENFEDIRSSSSDAVYLGLFQSSVNAKIVHEFHKFIRNHCNEYGDYEELDLILESGGGHLDASVKLVNICEQYSGIFNVYVPFYAKSAATLIALSAHNLYLGRAGELGPVDPQISHPIENNMMIQALSIRDAIDFIENDVSDSTIKEKLIDQLDTYWIGASQRAIDQAEEYLIDVARGADGEVARELVKNYKDHGYPIDRTVCEDMGVPILEEEEGIEDALYAIHDSAVDLYENDNLRFIISRSNNTVMDSADDIEIPEELIDELDDVKDALEMV